MLEICLLGRQVAKAACLPAAMCRAAAAHRLSPITSNQALHSQQAAPSSRPAASAAAAAHTPGIAAAAPAAPAAAAAAHAQPGHAATTHAHAHVHDEGSSRVGGHEAATYLHGAGTSLPDAVHSLRAAAHAMAGPSPEAEWAERHAAAAAPGTPPSTSTASSLWSAQVEPDPRMPALFVGMSAVYDIAKHYEFERSRCAGGLLHCLMLLPAVWHCRR